MMIYTSGTTGPPKGALQRHRVLLGHLPGIELPHEFLPQAGRLALDARGLGLGGRLAQRAAARACITACRSLRARFEQFDPEQAFALMAKTGVRNAFIPPTALRMLRAAPTRAAAPASACARSAPAAKSLGTQTLEWGKEALGLVVNEFYGQTECNKVLSSCAAIGVTKPGAIGKPVPGHVVAMITPDGTPCAPGETRSDRDQAARSGDVPRILGTAGCDARKIHRRLDDDRRSGPVDEEGYVHFVGRDDDVITSSGYRIGPSEIEDCLIRHPAVALAAAVGKPDRCAPRSSKHSSCSSPARRRREALAADIQAFVQYAALGARVSARDCLHRRHADDDDRKGHPTFAAGEGLMGEEETGQESPGRSRGCLLLS